jgi:dihydroorotate dehydrogenase electron transfer subunit
MSQTEARVVANREVAPEHFVLVLAAPEIARAAWPGQFVHVRCSATSDPLLCRPLSIAGVEEQTVRLVYRVVGRGTELLALRRAGDSVPLFGPLGRGFCPPANGANVVLVAGGVGVVPVVFLAQWLEANRPEVTATALVGAQRAELLLGGDDLRSSGVQVQVATDDGSLGHHGFPTDLLARELQERRPVVVYACGPHEMLRESWRRCAAAGVACQVGMENRMGCGVGACLGCVIRVRDAAGEQGYARVCRDGPVFDAAEVIWS